MTRQDFYALVAAYVRSVLGEDVKLWRAYQDAAPPTTGAYISIDDSTEWNPFGQPTQGATDGEEHQIRHDYEVVVGLWEIRGDGELLQALSESFARRAASEHFHAANTGVLSVGTVTKMPEILDTAKYVQRFRMEVVFGVARVQTETMPSIEAVEFTATFTHEP